jgi:hypothetical protein
MSTPKYLREFAIAYRSIPGDEFALRYGAPTLIGMGTIGTLNEEEPTGPRHTVSVQPFLKGDARTNESLMGRVWQIRGDLRSRAGTEITLGRNVSNDLVVPDLSVSTEHAIFRLTPQGVTVRDLGSHGGTFVDTERLAAETDHPLGDDVSLTIGRFNFQYYSRENFVSCIKMLAKLMKG